MIIHQNPYILRISNYTFPFILQNLQQCFLCNFKWHVTCMYILCSLERGWIVQDNFFGKSYALKVISKPSSYIYHFETKYFQKSLGWCDWLMWRDNKCTGNQILSCASVVVHAMSLSYSYRKMMHSEILYIYRLQFKLFLDTISIGWVTPFKIISYLQDFIFLMYQ